MEDLPLEGLSPSFKGGMRPMSLDSTEKGIMSVYKSTEFLYPKDGVWKEDNTVVTKSLSLTDDDAVSAVLLHYVCIH